MTTGNHKSGELGKTVIRICPACGVVNPSGPSDTCPHLQLARFDGVDEEMTALLDQVAMARRRFVQLVDDLKSRVKNAVRVKEAEIETPSKMTPKDVEGLRSSPASSSRLTLENPRSADTKSREPGRSSRTSRKRALQQRIDPRQLELIAREPPKGHA